MSSPKDKTKINRWQLNTSPLARASYLIPAARRRQLSSGPLGGFLNHLHMSKVKIFSISILIIFLSAVYACKSTTENDEKKDIILDQLYSNVSVGAISVLPNGVIIAVVDKGLLRSTDEGKSWQYCINDYPNGWIAFNKDGDVYIPARAGIYSSSNYGNTWFFADSISKVTYNGFVFGEIFSSITVTSNNYVFAVSGSSVYCSTNHGRSWYKPDTSFHKIYVDQICQVHDTIFVNGDLGLFRSTNYGVNWDQLNINDTWFSVLYTDSLNNIYLSHMFSSTYRSSDNGNTWQKIYDGSFEGFAVGKNNIIFSIHRHLLQSMDNGITWNVVVNVSDLGVVANTIALDKSGYLYVGASMNGIYRSKKSFYE